MISPEQSLGSRLAAKRRELGATYSQLSELTGLHSSTIRKLENGAIRHCRRQHVPRLQALISGQFDDRLRELQLWRQRDLPEAWMEMPPMAHQALGRVASAYNICNGSPELQAELLSAISETTRRIVRRFLDGA